MDSFRTSKRPVSAGAISNFSRRPLYTSETSWRLYSKAQARYSLPQRSHLSSHYRRWNPSFKMETGWDGFPTDHDLWFPDGDCFVYLCHKNSPGREPTFRIPHQALRNADCSHIIDPASLRTRKSARIARNISATASTGMLEVFLPAPNHSSDSEAFLWHVSTRNFLAWTLGKPLVGTTLSEAFHGLLLKMSLFRVAGVDNFQDFLSYAETVGYLDLSNNPSYALAHLQLAESYMHRDLYTESFVHCVGMYDSLPASREFLLLSRVSKSLMAQSSVELDLTVSKIANALDNFLEDEFSETHLGLGQGARIHLERFRTFLHSYHINKFGYWPLLEDASLCVGPYRIMHQEFHSLYDYLADKESSKNSGSQKLASGGLCVLQNIVAFDERHNLVALPYSLPLLPDPCISRRREPQRQSLSYRLSRKSNRVRQDLEIWSALSNAANPTDRSTTQCPLVQEYILFEKDACATPEYNLTVADARKVQWMLVYGMLQMLESLMKTPTQLKVTPPPNYALCCSTAGVPPWNPDGFEPLAQPNIVDIVRAPSPPLSIHPDCEGTDFFQQFRETEPDEKAPRPQSLAGPTISRVSSFRSLRSFSMLSLTPRRDGSILSRARSTGHLPRPKDDPKNELFPQMPDVPPSTTPAVKEWRNPLKLNPVPPRATTFAQSDDHHQTDTSNIDRLQRLRSPEGKRTPVLDIDHLEHFIHSNSSDSSVPSPAWSHVFEASDDEGGASDDDDDRSSASGDDDEQAKDHAAAAAADGPSPGLRRLSSIYFKPFDRLRSSVYSLILPQKRASQMSDGTNGNIQLADSYLQAVVRP